MMVMNKYNLDGKITAKQSVNVTLNNAIEKVYPELEILEIESATEKQTFKPTKYGYSEVIVAGFKINLQDKIITENGKYMADEGFDGLKMVDVKIPKIDMNEYFDFSKDLFKNSIIKAPAINCENRNSLKSYFQDCTTLITVEAINNTSNVTTMSNMFSGCTALVSIPKIDTSNIESAGSMFNNCINLITIPILNLSKLSGYKNINMFKNCSSLSDESLNNILQSFITAKNLYDKTLKFAGLTSEQATKCTTLSNYEAFVAAGWTTGY